MLYNTILYYFLEIYVILIFFLFLCLLTCWKLLQKSIDLNGIVCSVFIVILFSILLLQNYLFFIDQLYIFFENDYLIIFFKNIIIFFLLIFGIASYNYFNYYKEGYVLPDFYLLLIIFFFVNLVLLSINDVMLFYVLIELQNLIFFIFAAMIRNKWHVVEAAFRYFLVSGFSSLMFLTSITIFWGLTGVFDFSMYVILLENMLDFNFIFIFYYLSIIFFFFSFSLKLGIFPFHWWLVDVYEGVPLLIVFFFFVMPKIFLVYFVVKFFYIIHFFNIHFITMIYIFFIIGSLLWSVKRAMYQYSIIRFLVYSSIFNMAFIYVGITSYSYFGLVSTFVYLIIYLINNLGIFFYFLVLKIKDKNSGYTYIKTLFELSQFINTKRTNLHYLIFIFVIFVMSVAGIPPLLGFFSKFFILWNCFYSGSYFYFFILLGLSIAGSFYYLRLIRFSLFPAKQVEKAYIIIKLTKAQELVLSFLFFFQLFGIFFIYDFINLCIFCFVF